MSKRDYYEVLGASKSASSDEIRNAYRKKAKEYHPDRNAGDKDAEEKFKEINEAYEVLSDPKKKDRYDRYGHAGVDPSAGGFGGGFGGFEDVFSDIFDMFGGGSSRRRNGPRQGQNIQKNVNITFEEAVFGVEKEVEVTRYEDCDKCTGTGSESHDGKETCPNCHGTGEVRIQQRTPFGSFVNVRQCDKCSGTGTIIKDPCKTCKGTGKLRKKKTLKVNIPAGVDSESVISLRGEGEPGANGGPKGDLYIVLDVDNHPLFKRQGSDLILEMPITFPQAALGDEIIVPTMKEKISYKIPPGTQSGTIFRIKGKGIPYVNSNKVGDLYIKVIVEVPKKLKNEQKKLLQKLGESFEKDGNDQGHEGRSKFLSNMKDMLGL